MNLDELTTPLTREEIERAIYESLAAKGVNTTGWKPGAVVRTIITGTSIVLSAFSELQAAIARGGFLELAEGNWLTLVARHVYGVERIKGTFASGEVTLTNRGGGVYAGDPGDLVFSCSSGRAAGKTYRNTTPYSLPAFGTITIPIQAVEIGSGSTALPYEIDRLETVLLGVEVANEASVVGRDAETDAALRTRCKDKLGPLSPMGPRDAYASIARSAVDEDGEAIGVTRVRTVADGIGGLTVYVATPSGGVTDPAAIAAIQADTDRLAEPNAVTATVVSASPVLVAVAYELWVRSTIGLTRDQIEVRVSDALTELCANTPIGGDIIAGTVSGRLYLSAIKGAIADAIGRDYLVRLEVTSPVSDITLAAHEAPVFDGATVVGIHEVITRGA